MATFIKFKDNHSEDILVNVDNIIFICKEQLEDDISTIYFNDGSSAIKVKAKLSFIESILKRA